VLRHSHPGGWWIRNRCTAYTSNTTPAKYGSALHYRHADQTTSTFQVPFSGHINLVLNMPTGSNQATAFFNATAVSWTAISQNAASSATPSIAVSSGDVYLAYAVNSSSVAGPLSNVVLYFTPI
jgi:hypothetical protein